MQNKHLLSQDTCDRLVSCVSQPRRSLAFLLHLFDSTLSYIHSDCEVVVQVGVLVEQDGKHSPIFTTLHQTGCASMDMHKTGLFLMLLASGIIR